MLVQGNSKQCQTWCLSKEWKPAKHTMVLDMLKALLLEVEIKIHPITYFKLRITVVRLNLL